MTITAEQIVERLAYMLPSEGLAVAQSVLDTIRAEATAAAYGAAANMIQMRLDAYIADHGIYDPSTNITEFPGDGDEWVEGQEETVQAITALTDADATAWLAADRAAQFKAGQEAAIKGAVKGWAVTNDSGFISTHREETTAYAYANHWETIRPCLILVGEGE